MNNKVQNPKQEVNKGLELNDENYLNDILVSLKYLVSNYACALNEASNSNYYNIVKQLFNEVSLLQRDFFDASFQRGWYCLERADSEKINSAIQKLQPQIKELL